MKRRYSFCTKDARSIGKKLRVNWHKISLDQFTIGMNVELEHGTRNLDTNVTNDDSILTGKIALAHLNEFPDYYTRLNKYGLDTRSEKETFTFEDAKNAGDLLKVDWNKIDLKQLRRGMDVELEHGTVNPLTDVTNDDPILTAKIALGHLYVVEDYYIKLDCMEEEAEDFFKKQV